MSESKLLESVFTLVHQLKRNVVEHIEDLDLNLTPMHLRVLKIIKMKNSCTAIDIAHLLERDKAQVTRLLNTLIEQGLIEKVPNPEDKRSQRLLVTDKASDILQQIRSIDLLVVKKLTQGLSEQELGAFQDTLNRFNQNLVK